MEPMTATHGDEEFQVVADEWWKGYDQFEPWTLDLVGNLGKTDIMVDVGAWIGPVSLYASQFADHVLALEPDPIAARVLRRNVDLNGITNVNVVESALAAKPGQRRLYQGGEHWWGSSMSSLANQAGERMDVSAIDLYEMLRLLPGKPDLIKVDIEGGEDELFTDAAIWALLGCPIILSLHFMWLSDGGGPLLSRLRDHFTVESLFAHDMLPVVLLTP